MQQIANRLGLSKFAVSKALSGQKGVSENTRRLVIETAKALGYVPPITAPRETAQLTPSESYVLVWSAPGVIGDPHYWRRVLNGIVTGCERLGWRPVMLTLDKQEPPTFPDYLDRNSCAGIILAGTIPSNTVLEVRRLQLPIVLANHNDPLSGLDAVLDQNMEAAMQAVGRLHGSGCRSLAFVGNDEMSLSFLERRWGFETAAKQVQLDYIISQNLTQYPNEGWEEHVGKALDRVLKETGLPDGWVTANDLLALELINQLVRKGYRVPEDTKVIGFDNIESSSYTKPALTTFELAMEMLGIRSVDALQRRIEKPDALPETVRLAYRLIVRDSG